MTWIVVVDADQRTRSTLAPVQLSALQISQRQLQHCQDLGRTHEINHRNNSVAGHTPLLEHALIPRRRLTPLRSTLLRSINCRIPESLNLLLSPSSLFCFSGNVVTSDNKENSQMKGRVDVNFILINIDIVIREALINRDCF